MDDSEQIKERLKPPSTNAASSVLNGIGNGMMVGTLPFVFGELYNNIKGKKPSPSASKGMMFAFVGGCTLGAAYGVYEARQNKKYEHAINDEITELHSELDTQKATIKSWQERHAAREHHTGHADHEHSR